jgi:hypothetical protein
VNDIELTFKEQSTGAKWEPGSIGLDTGYSQHVGDTLKGAIDPNGLALIAHEATHLEQGAMMALSVRGELEGWQVQYQVNTDLGGQPLEPRQPWDEIARLPLSSDVDNLIQARKLMIDAAGWGYLVWLLPLGVGYGE